MKCPICGREMQEGYIKARKSFSPFNWEVELTFYPNEDKSKLIKWNSEGLNIKGEGYYCNICKKAVGIFDKKC